MATSLSFVLGIVLLLTRDVTGAAVGSGCSDVCEYSAWAKDAQCAARNLRLIPQECRSAKTLCVSDNRIARLQHGAFTNFTSLRYLNLDRNNLTLETGSFIGCGLVERIQLNHNLVPTLTPGVTEGLSRVMYMYADSVGMEDILPNTFKNMTSLHSLSMNNNKLSSPPCSSAFGQDSNLQFLYLSNNEMSHLPDYCFANNPKLTKLYLRGNNLINVNPKAFRGLNKLVHLELSNNMLQWVPSEMFTHANNIEFLSLSHNQITFLFDEDFDGLSGLQELYLQYNRITVLRAPTFLFLGTLRILNISYNSLRSIEEGALQGPTQLEELALQNNQMNSTKNITFSEIPPTARIRLENNPLYCDCSIYPFMYWLETRSSETHDLSRCVSPPKFAGSLVTELDRHELCPVSVIAEPRMPTDRPTDGLAVAGARQHQNEQDTSSTVPITSVQWIAIIACIIVVFIILIMAVICLVMKKRNSYNPRYGHGKLPDKRAVSNGNIIINREAPSLPPRRTRQLSSSSTAPLICDRQRLPAPGDMAGQQGDSGYMSPEGLLRQSKCSTAPNLTTAFEIPDDNWEDNDYDEVEIGSEDDDYEGEPVEAWVQRKFSSTSATQPTGGGPPTTMTGYVNHAPAMPDRKKSGYVPHVPPAASGNVKA